MARQLNVDVVEFVEAQYTKDVFVNDETDDDSVMRFEYSDQLDNQSQINQIKSFLSQCNTFFKKQKRLVVIKEFPSTLLNDPEKYHVLWTWYYEKFHKKGVPIVFICTTDNGKDSFIGRIFTKKMRDDFNVDEIKFNPPTKKQMIAYISKKIDKKVAAQDLESLISDDRCDLRSVINSVNIKFGDQVLGGNGYSQNPRKRRVASSLSSGITSRDQGINIHHYIARILHAKRHHRKFSRATSLPNHLKQYERVPLDRDPFEMVDSCPLENSKLIMFLLQNYPDFCSNLECAGPALEWLSIADTLQGDTAEASESLEVYRNSLVIAGTMFDLHPRDETGSKKFGIDSNQDYLRSQRRAKDAREELKSKCFQYKDHSSYELLHDILPYISVMNTAKTMSSKKKYGKTLLELTIFKTIERGGFDSSREQFRAFRSTEPLVNNRNDEQLVMEVESDEEQYKIECSEESD